MPPKKGKKKKGKKKKQKENVVEEVVTTEYDNWDIEALKEEINTLKTQLEKAQLDRNYVQLERDTIQTFFDITRKDVSDLSKGIMMKDREMEMMEDNHRVEVRVYIQKVKHLEYEHKNSTKRVQGEGESALVDAKEEHTTREVELKRGKKELVLQLKERELANQEEINNMRQQHDKNLTKLREEFQKTLNAIKDKYEGKVHTLRSDLQLRRKVEIHEIEERKNLHINDLMKNHEKAFGQIKNYYNDITHDNLKLIRQLKDEVAEMKSKAAANQKLMLDIAQENKRLSDPLSAAVAEVEQLQAGLKDYAKDRLSLKNAQARLLLLEEQQRSLQRAQASLENQFAAVAAERDELHNSFEQTVRQVQRKSEFVNLVLERKLDGVSEEYERREAQFKSVLMAANLDPSVLASVTARLDEVLDSRNAMIWDLKYNVNRVTKSHNDVIRTFESKLGELGVPQEELQLRQMMTETSTMPAGLVATM